MPHPPPARRPAVPRARAGARLGRRRGALLGALVAGAAAGLAPGAAGAQGSGVYGQGIRLNLDTTGRKYVRFILWNQTWLRQQQFNPETRVNGQDAQSNFDIGIRRSRFIAYGQLTASNLVMLHVGINNQTFNSGGAPGEPTGPGKKPQVFIHDLWYEQRLVPGKLYRRRRPVVLERHLAHDEREHAQLPRHRRADLQLPEHRRQRPVRAHARRVRQGQARQARLPRGALAAVRAGRRALRAAHHRAAGATLGRIANQAVYSNTTRTKATQGYLMWQFLEQESNTLPFTVGSYLGTRRVFNLGGGWYNQPAAMRSYTGRTGADSLRHHRQTLLGADVFADLPFGPASNRTALTVYGVLYNYNFGPNFVRNVGIMNEGTPGPTPTGQGAVFNGGGNAAPLIGTGTIAHVEAGYLLPKGASRGVGRFQPYAWLTRSDFERFDDAFLVPEGGVNWHLEGHHTKYTLHYRSRPIFRQVVSAPTPGGPVTAVPVLRPDGLARQRLDGRRGEIILQAQMYF
jgi:hypothetical protein